MKTKTFRALCIALSLLMFITALPFAVSASQLPASIPVVRLSGGQAKLTDVEKSV